MSFEIFTLLFHIKCVRDDLSLLLLIKQISKESIAAYKNTRSSIFVNALMLHNTVVESVELEYGLKREFFTETLSFLSEQLTMYDGYGYMRQPLFSMSKHSIQDPFYPAKTKTIPGQVLRFRIQLKNNKYLDSIINYAYKPTKKIIY